MTDFNLVELPYKTANPTAAASASVEASNGLSYTLASNSNLSMDKSTLKVHLPDGSFNVVRFGDATDIKVSALYLHRQQHEQRRFRK